MVEENKWDARIRDLESMIAGVRMDEMGMLLDAKIDMERLEERVTGGYLSGEAEVRERLRLLGQQNLYLIAQNAAIVRLLRKG